MPHRLPPVGPKRLEIAAPAEADIAHAVAYIAEVAGSDVALRFAEKIDAELQRLVQLGHAGVSRELISPGLRMMVLGQYCAYFRVTDDRTRIIRFLHSARDIRSASFSGPEQDEPAC